MPYPVVASIRCLAGSRSEESCVNSSSRFINIIYIAHISEKRKTLKDSCAKTLKTRSQNLIELENKQQQLDKIVMDLYGIDVNVLANNEYSPAESLESVEKDQDEDSDDDNVTDYVYG